MNNAFDILGAEPSDNAERLQELLDEKELLLDNSSEAQAAYADLTNPKKRIPHEINYFCSDALENYNKLVNHSFEEPPTVGQIANIVVELGRWFELDDDELFDSINDTREEGGYPQIDEIDIVTQAVQSLKEDCKQSINAYLDGLKERSLVGIFNQIVKIKDYGSFFIDELLAHYEQAISEIVNKKEEECLSLFTVSGPIPMSLSTYVGLVEDVLPSSFVNNFRNALKDWDNYVQPLQVNMQRHGGQHKRSEKMASIVRNMVIDICNASQSRIGKLINDISYQPTGFDDIFPSESYKRAQDAAKKLPETLPDCITLTNQLIEIIDILNSVFAELDSTAEQLNNDKKELSELKSTLEKINNEIQAAKREADRQKQLYQSQTSRTFTPSSSSCCDGCYVATCVYGSYDCPEVWTLRRYRDKTLGSTWYGRLFIRLYYAISPTLVKWFGKTKWFKKMWKGVLDKKVKLLQAKGFEDTPYEDIDWRKNKFE